MMKINEVHIMAVGLVLIGIAARVAIKSETGIAPKGWEVTP